MIRFLNTCEESGLTLFRKIKYKILIIESELIDKAFLKTYIYTIFKLTQTIKEFCYDKRNKRRCI